MKHLLLWGLSFILLTTLPLQAHLHHDHDFSRIHEIRHDNLKRIDRAIPNSAQAIPKKPRKVLVYNLHYVHDERRPGHASIPYINYALIQMGERHDLWELTFSEDINDLNRENLKQYDALCFQNTAGVLTYDEELRSSLLDFVYAGGGFIGIHAAGATFAQWPKYDYFPEFGEMLGGFESGGHPWKADHWITLRFDDPAHPVNSAFKESYYDVMDEVFQFTDPYSPNHLRVLNSIDPELTDMDPSRNMLPERMVEKDFSISWVKRYGRGRVFYTSIGHNDIHAWDPKVLQLFQDGMQFAIGDLKGPTTPTAKLTPAVKAQEKLGWNFGIAAYSFKDNTLFESIEKVDSLGLAYIGGLNVQTVSADIPKKLDHNLTDTEIRAIRSKLNKHGITMLTYFVFDIPGDEAEARKIFEFGKKLGVETFLSEPKPENLDLVEKLCIEYNIKVAIHNHGQRLSPVYMYPEQILEVTKGRSPLIGAACDFGYWARAGIDPYEAIKLLGDRVITMQMHDLHEMSPDGHDVPWGTGVVKLDKILKHLRDNDINPVMFGLEYSRNWDNNIPEISESVAYFNDLTLKLAK